MPENILEKIIKNKTEKIEILKKTIPSESLNDLIKTNSTFVNFMSFSLKNLPIFNA